MDSHTHSSMLSSLAPRADFPLLAANPGLHYLDSAATSQKPAAVLDALRGFYETANANPHRGAYALSAKATDVYHEARATIARFVGVSDTDCLIFTRGTTEAMNLVVSSWGRANVQAGDEVVITALESIMPTLCPGSSWRVPPAPPCASWSSHRSRRSISISCDRW